MESNLLQTTLEDKIRDLLHEGIQAHDLRKDDDVSFKTFKLILAGKVLDCFALDWSYLLSLFKTHTLVHPDMVKELHCDEEEVDAVLAQLLIRNEKLMRLLKVFNHHHGGKFVNRILAVDGLNGWDQKHYVGNLRYGYNGKSFFDKSPEYKRLHVQTVRHMYGLLENVPVPEKQVYEILRLCFEDTAKTDLPVMKFTSDEQMDSKLQEQVIEYYLTTMGKENIANLIRTISLKRVRGEKRTVSERDVKTECKGTQTDC